MSREYKDSGIEWIGQIPKEWKLYRIKYNTFLKGRIGWQGLNSNDFIDEGYYLITGTDFDNKGGINWNTCYKISKERFDEDELLHVKEGDLLMTKDGTVGKMAFIKELPEEASLNSHLLIIRQLTNLINNSFLYWVMLSEVFKGFCSHYQSGTIMSSISQSTLGFFACFAPPLSEQQKIADYLDKVCGEADEMIALQEKMIEELKAYKQSVITEAVTKGLNPNVPMKDSGIEWIGEIPKHWVIMKIGFIFSNLDYLRKPISAEQRERNNPQYDYYGASGVIDKIDHYNVDDKVLLIGEDGANLVMRNLPLVYKAEGRFWVNNHAHILKPIRDDYDYMASALEAANYRNYITGSAQPKLSQENLQSVKLPVPPLSEQRQIASYLDTICSDIDSLISIKQQKIEELKEYKKSVIYEYVTGKKEVV